jgi:hypothetical protein
LEFSISQHLACIVGREGGSRGGEEEPEVAAKVSRQKEEREKEERGKDETEEEEERQIESCKAGLTAKGRTIELMTKVIRNTRLTVFYPLFSRKTTLLCIRNLFECLLMDRRLVG